MSYLDYVNSRINHYIDTVQGYTNPYGNQCTVLAWDYCAWLYPDVSFRDTIGQVDAKDMFDNANPNYFIKIRNDPNDPNQLPPEGAIMIFNATPQDGYMNKYNNPYGHVGMNGGATSAGFWLLQQNAPASGQIVNSTFYDWKFRPCIGWLIPKVPQVVIPPVTVPETPQDVVVPEPAVEPPVIVPPIVEPPVVVVDEPVVEEPIIEEENEVEQVTPVSNVESTAVIIRNLVITFLETGLGAWYASGMKTDKVAVGAAIGVAVSAVWNTIVKPLLKKIGWIK